MFARLFAGRAAAWLAAVLCALFAASAAQAQAVRYVSVAGSDANPCTLAAPCRTLATTIGGAPDGAEVRLLDSGPFGPGVTIAKSLTISGDGNTLILSGSAAITVSDATANVTLRGLLLNGLGTVGNGILVSAAASLHIVGCELERFTIDGVRVGAGGSEVFVSDSIFRNNGNDGFRVDGGGSTRVMVENSRFENNAEDGADISGEISVTRSTFSGNGDVGLDILGGAASVAWSTAAHNGFAGFAVDGGAEAQLESSVARANEEGLFVGDSSAIVSVSNMTVADNNVGINNFGTVRTRQNNRIFGNNIDFAGPAPAPLGGT